MRIWPACNVTGGIDAADAGLQEGIHGYAAIDDETGLFRQRQARSHTYAYDHKIGLKGSHRLLALRDCR